MLLPPHHHWERKNSKQDMVVSAASNNHDQVLFPPSLSHHHLQQYNCSTELQTSSSENQQHIFPFNLHPPTQTTPLLPSSTQQYEKQLFPNSTNRIENMNNGTPLVVGLSNEHVENKTNTPPQFSKKNTLGRTENNHSITPTTNNIEMNTRSDSNTQNVSPPTIINPEKIIQSMEDNVKTTQSKLFTVLNFPIVIIITILNTMYQLLVNSWEYVCSLFFPQSKKKKQRKSKENENSTQHISTSSTSSLSPLPPLAFLSVLFGRTSRPSVEKSQQPKKYLILDLDETLIHASTTPPRADHERLYNYVLDVQIDHVNCTFYVSERPHLKLFMEKVCEWYNVVIFTASVKNYANPVIDRLYHSDKIVKRLFRSSCYVTEHGVYVKDLKTVTEDLTKCMIIDNSPISYMWYQENAIPISNWMGDNERDRALLNLLPFLEAMRHLEDVKSILSFRVGL